MLVQNRYGGLQRIPDRLAKALIRLGTVKAIEEKKPEPVKQRKTKAKDSVAETEVE